MIMMSFIANAGAVPLGYVSAMTDGQGQCHRCGGLYSHHNEVMPLQHLQRFNVFPPLPDIILSNAPSPSPHQQEVSCPFYTDRNNYTGRLHKGLKIFQKDPPPRTGRKSATSQGTSLDRIYRLVRSFRTQGAQRREEARDHFTRGCRVDSTGSHDQECQSSHLISIPQFIRQVTPCSRLHQDVVDRQRSMSLLSHEYLNQERCCTVGKELLKVADRFQLDHGRALKKNKRVAVLSLVLPEAFTQCFAASVLCLIWWRLLNKLR
ncbi:uncharacterized protein [Palaemon carinicauda]|uniref:uncharacterized protein n=1 Tax=Palaemon carinicauda TaxID=392227 RepID=UPI0035B661B8